MKLIRLMERILRIFFAFSALLLFRPAAVSAQNGEYDVFIPISKYISQGNADKLSAWFADNLEVSIGSSSYNSSKSQARQIVKNFFDANPPRSFAISHTAGKNNMKYAIGTMKTGGEVWLVTVFVNIDGQGYKIQHLKIEVMP